MPYLVTPGQSGRGITEHYSEALNHPTAVPCPELDAQQFQAVDDPEVLVDAPTLNKVRAAIKKLKFGRAAGRDAIPPEMLKLAIDPTSCILHQLFASVQRLRNDLYCVEWDVKL